MSVALREQLGDALVEAKQKYADLEAMNERLRSNILQLFRLFKAEGKRCRLCNLPVYWLRKVGFKPVVLDPDGTSHWLTCRFAAQARPAAEARGGKV